MNSRATIISYIENRALLGILSAAPFTNRVYKSNDPSDMAVRYAIVDYFIGRDVVGLIDEANRHWVLSTPYAGFNQHDDPIYHCFEHEVVVALMALWAGLSLRLYKGDICALFIAGLYHDHGHSLGKLSDSDNIARAISVMDSVYENPDSELRRFLTEHEFSRAKDLVRATQYPYKGDPQSPAEFIIRDADLSMMVSENYFRLIDGLKNEMRVENFEALQYQWMQSFKWHNSEQFGLFDGLRKLRINAYLKSLGKTAQELERKDR